MAQPEIAIAALQDVSRKEIDNVEVYQILTEAYAAIELNEEALLAGRQAVQLAPDNVEILSWFADKAVDFGASEAAIPSLVRAVEIDPKRADLAVRLAEIFLDFGKKIEAHELLLKILSNPHAAPDDLFKAAIGFGSLEDDKNSAACLERALELQPDPPLQMLTDLTSAYHAKGEDELALRTIEIAVDRHADNPEVHKIKADILTSLGRFQAAQASLEHALVLVPTDPSLYYQLASLLIEQGRLIEARELTRKMVEFIDNHQIDRFSMKALEFSADIARSVLDLDSARTILSKLDIDSAPEEKLTGIISGPQDVDYFCLKAELALDVDEEIAAAAAVNQIVNAGSSHPRVLALQARLSWRQGDPMTAGEFFSRANKAVTSGAVQQGEDIPDRTNSIVGVALAAIDLELWDQAVDLLTALIKNSKPSPFISVQAARSIILKEEYHRLCKALNVTNHVPERKSSIEEELQVALRTLESVKVSLPDDLLENQPILLKRWQARCQALLHPGPEAVRILQELPPDPSDQAALITTLAQMDDLVAIYRIFRSLQNQYRETSIHHLILAQFANAICQKGRRQDDIDESIQAARAAIDQKPDQPLYYVILARLSQASGDLKTALDAFQTALSFWPDEPRWHASAAKVALAVGDAPAAIDHLDRAIALEPAHIPHYLALGEAYLQIGNPNQAVRALEHALELAPNRVEAHLALASAQLACGRMKEAAETAGKAISLAPDEISPLLLGAEIHLKTGEPEKSKRYAEAALTLKPENPTANHLLARALEKLGRPEESLRVIEKALPNAANPIPLLLQRAKLIGYAHGESAAFDALQELSNRYPDEPFILAELAKNLAKSGNQDQAIQTAQKALRSGNGHLSQEERADLHYLLGTLLRQSGQLDQAVHQLSEAARQSPQNLEIYLDLGKLFQERRQYGKAIETLRKALVLAPEDPRPYYQIGVALRESHDFQAAETMLRRAAELAPKDVSIHRQLAALIALNLVHNNH
jgi:tetratricopeptide (TPR) repeat protein